VARVFGEETQPEYLSSLATEIAKAEKAVALLGLAAGGNLLFAQHASAGLDMNALLKEVFARFGGKGGGTRDFARGKLADGAQTEQAIEFARNRVLEG
jgi:alanyl-tRNA synthetase